MLVVIDLETTGLDPEKDKIIEVALVKFDPKNFKIKEEFSSLIDPEIPIPEINSSITNIYDSDVRGSPKWGEILQEISDFIGDYPLVGHNVSFDIGFLKAKGISVEDHIVLDTFLLANFLVLGEKSLSLEYLCKYFKIPLLGAHRALNDTKATLLLFNALLGRLRNFSIHKKKIISFILGKSQDTGMRYIKDNFLRDIDEVSKEDFLKYFQKILPKKKRYEDMKIDSSLKEFLFSDYIDLDKHLEKRENQIKMSEIVYDSLNGQKFSAIEAPTGIGKTYAYIIPSIFHSLKTGEQVFVSTSTKALQDQIFFKDLMGLKKNGKLPFTFSKLKGKRNYLGIGSFLSFLESEDDYTQVKTSFLLKMLMWLSVTSHGELDELEYYGQEFSFLFEVNADDLYTFSSENVYGEREFAVTARRQSKKTNIVVINNNILFQDTDRENSILSKVENLILDEAHNLEDVLTQSLQKSFCLDDLEKSFYRIERKLGIEEKKISGSGLKIEKILFEVSLLFDIFNSYLNRKIPSNSKYKTHLIHPDFYANEGKNITHDSIGQKLQVLFIEYLDSLQSLEDKVYNSLSREISYIENCLDVIGKCISSESLHEYICFLNFNERRGLFLEYTYLNPGEYLKKTLWKNVSSCLLTSATLKTGVDFAYVKQMLHLESFNFFDLETDFDYEKQALLFVPNDIGSIKNNLGKVIDFMEELMITVRGKTLFLCTSFHTIKEVFSGIDRPLKKQGIHIYAQSLGGGKKKLIDFYSDNAESSLLIGTNTFWEGVDIPGEKLQYLVIHKIPFMVPTDPIFQARSALFSDSFREYAIPKAILRLKQGFGRLIRTRKDTGVVIFLDDRIYSSSWGGELYKSFPKGIKIKTGGCDDLIKVLQSIK